VKKKLFRIAEYLSAAPEFSGARVPLVKKKLFRIAEYLSAAPEFSGIRVALSSVFYMAFCRPLVFSFVFIVLFY
jgi:hypothetical protein